MILLLMALQTFSVDYLPTPELRFVFTRADARDLATIAGSGPRPAVWTRSAFYQVVRRCGGKRVGSDSGYNSITIFAESNASNFKVAECVKASTGANFRVGVYGQSPRAGFFVDQQPFERLWNRKDARVKALRAGG